MSLRSFFMAFHLFEPENTFLFIEDVKDYAAAYSIKAEDLQHEIHLVSKIQLKHSDLIKSAVKFFSFSCNCKAAFDC